MRKNRGALSAVLCFAACRNKSEAARWRPFRRVVLSGLVVAIALLPASFAPAQTSIGSVPFRQQVPSDRYFYVLREHYEGQYKDSLADFSREVRGCIKIGSMPFIDSICYHAMTGEACYQLGRVGDALDQYNIALRVFAQYPDWMLRVHFQQNIVPLQANQMVRVPWGQSTRGSTVGNFRGRPMMERGQINNNAQVQLGGVVQKPFMHPVDAGEVVRCTALALRRRHELLGTLAAEDDLTNDVLSKLKQRPAAPNHWSAAWIDGLLGLAHLMAGEDDKAEPLMKKAIVAEGRYDHPLTATMLLELGKLALKRGVNEEAASYFAEATYAGAQFADADVVEEAFRLGAILHMTGGNETTYPPLTTAMVWAQQNDFGHLQASLAVLLAENLAVIGRGNDAVNELTIARGLMSRNTMRAARVGAALNYVTAKVGYQVGNSDAAATALASGIQFQQQASARLFQIGLVNRDYDGKDIGQPRRAMNRYEVLLRDPTSQDWQIDPLDTLTVLLTPHAGAYEHWFLAALARKQVDAAVEIADRARRHRFFTYMPLGGRALGLRWVLEGAADVVGDRGLLQRQQLLQQLPDYDKLSRAAHQLGEQVDQLRPRAADPDTFGQLASATKQLGEVSRQQETLLRHVALGRMYSPLTFPPMRPMKEIQERLGPGQAVLVFFETTGRIHAVMISKDKYATWPVGAPATIHKSVAALLKSIGNIDANRPVDAKQFANESWQANSNRLLASLMKGFGRPFPDDELTELAIVPDGPLWYVPWESLRIGEGADAVPLVTKVQLRIAPFASLSVPGDSVPAQRAGTAVVVGKLYPRDDDDVTKAAYQELDDTLDDVVRIDRSLPMNPRLFGAGFGRLVVYDDLADSSSGGVDWTMMPTHRGRAGSTLADWLVLPLEAPRYVVLPGFHSAAETGLRVKGGTASGDELFVATSALLAAGSRTVLISRWRPAGQTSYDLVREFVQELPFMSPAASWQRSVLLASQGDIDPAVEPRVDRDAARDPPSASHPFFWSGYLLVDSGTPQSKEDKAEGEKDDFNLATP